MNKTGSGSMLWSVAIILCLIASLFALSFASCTRTGADASDGGLNVEHEDLTGLKPEDDDGPSSPSAPEGNGAPGDPSGETGGPAMGTGPVRLGETPDAGREYLDKLIFLGDSTTYGIGYYYDRGFSEELVPPSQVWTPASGTLTLAYYATATIVYPETGEEISIRDAVERSKPEYLVITLGVNGLSFMDKDWFIRDYTSLVEMVKTASPETKIILNSIYPVTAGYPYQKDINNEKIRAANGWIEQIAADTGVRFLYSHEAVADADGNLPEDSTNDIGIHLTGEAFTKVMRYIRTHEYR